MKNIWARPFCRRSHRHAEHAIAADHRKWHAHSPTPGDSRDSADEFRGDPNKTQEMLREFARSLHWMAYGRDGKDEPSPPVIKPEELKNYFAKIPFGIEGGDIIDTPTTTAINKDEAAAVDERRQRHEVTTEKGTDAIGLALSGGGIRSATFCLGVVQVLAERNLFKDIDFLSTVSGGGYVGCFITTRLGKVETGTVAPEIAAPGITPKPWRQKPWRQKPSRQKPWRRSLSPQRPRQRWPWQRTGRGRMHQQRRSPAPTDLTRAPFAISGDMRNISPRSI